MFHAERHKYAPLKGTSLIYFGDDKKLSNVLADICSELGLIYSQVNEVTQWEELIADGNQPSIVIDSDELEELSSSDEKIISSIFSQMLILNGKNSTTGEISDKVVEKDESGEQEQAMKILDKLLASYHNEVVIDENFESVNFDYLKSTFSEKDNRYKKLMDMMFLEFLEAKEIISEALEKGKIEKYREFKHKLQPSANYLRLNDLINVMEAIKDNFDQLHEKRNKHLVPKMMKYFDTILEALAKEKG